MLKVNTFRNGTSYFLEYFQVNLLLLHHASPVILNKDKKSPLDLASEFGRYRVSELFAFWVIFHAFLSSADFVFK